MHREVPDVRRPGGLLFLGMVTWLLTLGGAAHVYACSVPVFRYALEEWNADPYVVEVVHRGPLHGEAVVARDLLDSYARGEEVSANFVVSYVDAEKRSQGMESAHTQGLTDAGEARMTVYLPVAIGRREPVWSGPLTREAVKKIVDSPLRREIARRLLRGDSIVWILLESGDEKTDVAAATLLEEQLKVLETTLKLPELPMPQEEAIPATEDGTMLRLAFSLVRLGRDDEAEAFLVASLLRTEPDLPALRQPMAFPIFGRGRVLYALAGKGINAENIRRACEFLIGPCSCIVKAENPGVDLLMAADWELHMGALVVTQELPPLAGVTDLIAPEKAASPAPPARELPKPKTAPASGGLPQSVLIVMGSAFVLIVIGTLVMRHAKTKRERYERSAGKRE